MAYCSQCGSQLSPDARYCGSCGAAISAATDPAQTLVAPSARRARRRAALIVAVLVVVAGCALGGYAAYRHVRTGSPSKAHAAAKTHVPHVSATPPAPETHTAPQVEAATFCAGYWNERRATSAGTQRRAAWLVLRWERTTTVKVTSWSSPTR